METNLDIVDQLMNGPSGSGQRVVVAMSGGVDSSVVAAMLKHQGYDVVGVTLQLYDHGPSSTRKGSCCAGQDIYDARNVADQLKIPHYVLNYEKIFSEKVITPFTQSYHNGETPIPCVLCNKEIKFKDLFEMAMELGAQKLATGHYIQLQHTSAGPILTRARDPERDQSYFLYATERSQLEKLLFPIGGLLKHEVRRLAQHFQLAVADKSDSQDICFVPTGHYTDVIKKLKPESLLQGDIVHINGQKIGKHSGIINFTVGQRKGIGIAGPEPLYVVRLDVDQNQVIVGPRQSLLTQMAIIRDINWLGDDPLIEAVRQKRRVYVRVRSSQPTKPAVLTDFIEDKLVVAFCDPQEAVASGQACVFYSDGSLQARVLGGGIIHKKLEINQDEKISALKPYDPKTSSKELSMRKAVEILNMNFNHLEERGS